MLATTTIAGNDLSTPDVLVFNDNLGRPESISQPNQSKMEYEYDPDTLRLDTETVSYDLDHNGSFEFTRTLDRANDFLGRTEGYTLKDGADTDAKAHYGYDPLTGRLKTVDDSGLNQDILANSHFTYYYVENSTSNLIDSVHGGRIRVYNTWENDRDLLKKKENLAISLMKNYSTFIYTTNPIGQREKVVKTGQDSQSASITEFERRWGYDSFGQLTQENDILNDAFDRGFDYDAIGNRTKSIAGSTDVSAAGAVTYTPTALNQYSAITDPASALITPQYDDDGNTKTSSIRPKGMPDINLQTAIYDWDGENRLVRITRPNNTLIASYQYDAFGRRIEKKDGGDYESIWVYDGWNPIARYGSPSDLFENYLWGLDISGSLQGAGGVGGLLAISYTDDEVYLDGNVHYPTYDGNGNVSEYIEPYPDPNLFFPYDFVVAHYQYDAFGNVTHSDGWRAEYFPFRFSTKQQDDESGLLYYGYRYYDPLTGRWLSRDPIGEMGGVNLYGFVGNSGPNRLDSLGLKVSGEMVGSCFVITVKMKTFVKNPLAAGDAGKSFKTKYPNASKDIVDSHEEKMMGQYNKINKYVSENLEGLEKILTGNLNKVYSDKDCCCIKFSISLSQGGGEKSMVSGDDYLIFDWKETGVEGQADIGGHKVEIGIGILEQGNKGFAHEIGHMFGLRHPHPDEMGKKDKEGPYGGLNGTAMEDMLYSLGYDRENNLRGIGYDENIMAYGSGSDVTCEQLNAIKENVKNRPKN